MTWINAYLTGKFDADKKGSYVAVLPKATTPPTLGSSLSVCNFGRFGWFIP
jgi:hypothetical protein